LFSGELAIESRQRSIRQQFPFQFWEAQRRQRTPNRCASPELSKQQTDGERFSGNNGARIGKGQLTSSFLPDLCLACAAKARIDQARVGRNSRCRSHVITQHSPQFVAIDDGVATTPDAQQPMEQERSYRSKDLHFGASAKPLHPRIFLLVEWAVKISWFAGTIFPVGNAVDGAEARG
jgi:hypothetical protein